MAKSVPAGMILVAHSMANVCICQAFKIVMILGGFTRVLAKMAFSQECDDLGKAMEWTYKPEYAPSGPL